MKLKCYVDCIMPARCLHENGDSSEIDAFMKKNILKKKRKSLKCNKKKTYFPSDHRTSSPFNSTVEITA